jgi:hypothetical protein
MPRRPKRNETARAEKEEQLAALDREIEAQRDTKSRQLKICPSRTSKRPPLRRP